MPQTNEIMKTKPMLSILISATLLTFVVGCKSRSERKWEDAKDAATEAAEKASDAANDAADAAKEAAKEVRDRATK